MRVHRTMVPRATATFSGANAWSAYTWSPQPATTFTMGEVTGPDVIVKLPFIPLWILQRYWYVPGTRLLVFRSYTEPGGSNMPGPMSAKAPAGVKTGLESKTKLPFERVAVDVTVCTPPTRSQVTVSPG